MTPNLAARLRKNHAIEHATVAVLLERRGRMVGVGGLSDPWGFQLAGNFEPQEIESCAREALRRLHDGERHLAITNQCGTNLAITGVLTATAALLAARGQGFRRWQPAATFAVFGAMAAQPAGRWLQAQLTTDANVRGIEVTRVTRLVGRSGASLIRVSTRPSPPGSRP